MCKALVLLSVLAVLARAVWIGLIVREQRQFDATQWGNGYTCIWSDVFSGKKMQCPAGGIQQLTEDILSFNGKKYNKIITTTSSYVKSVYKKIDFTQSIQVRQMVKRNDISVVEENLPAPKPSLPTAVALIKTLLEETKVSKKDALRVQHAFEKHAAFTKWHGTSDSTFISKISATNMDSLFLTWKDAYHWSQSDYLKAKVGTLTDENMYRKLQEMRFDGSSDGQIAKYGLLAMARHPDNHSHFMVMYVEYKVDFQLATYIPDDEDNLISRFLKWTTGEEGHPNTIGTSTIDAITNLFRYKALKEFQTNGLLDDMRICDNCVELDYISED